MLFNPSWPGGGGRSATPLGFLAVIFFEKLFFCMTNLEYYYFDVMQTLANFEKKNGFQPYFGIF